MANPDQRSIELALLGFRSYWLWWLAPLVVASVLERERDSARAMTTLGIFAVIIAAFAVLQFSLPPGHPLNRYAATGPDMEIAKVATTGRARVTATFSYITGFTDFITIVPALLLSVGLATRSGTRRLFLIGSTMVSAISMPTSGSRAPVLLCLGTLAIVAYAAGFFWTNAGRRVLVAGGLAITAALLFSGDALQGLQDRFTDDPEESRSRVTDAIVYLPPFALGLVDYPVLGIGTGTLQNAAVSYGATQRYAAEAEQHRVLIEQGAPGYLLLSLLRIGLVVALFRAGMMLKRAGERAPAGAAWALGALTLPGNLFFDHIFQALYFLALGIVLQIVVRTRSRTFERNTLPAAGPR